jgi:uncharacterized protein
LSSTGDAGCKAIDTGNQVKQKLQDDLKAAMKAGDKLRLMTLRGIISEITRVEKDVRRPANETEIVQVIKRERARREEALEFARKAARDDLIAQNSTEAKILDEYLPAAADIDAVKAAITDRIATGVNQIGPLMKALRDQFGAQLDGKIASELVKQAVAAKP